MLAAFAPTRADAVVVFQCGTGRAADLDCKPKIAVFWLEHEFDNVSFEGRVKVGHGFSIGLVVRFCACALFMI